MDDYMKGYDRLIESKKIVDQIEAEKLEALILRKQAEAVDQAADRLKMSTRWGVEPFRRGMNTAYGHVTGYAEVIRLRADELERKQ